MLMLLRGWFKELDRRAESVLADVFLRRQKTDGSFRLCQLLYGWDNVPMHRWAPSQMVRSLCFLLHVNYRKHPVIADS
jgi:hypothetical protein